MQTNVSDETIARYLNGTATPQEMEAVLAYLSEQDERVDDLLAMTAAVEQFAPHKPKKRLRPLWPAISAAASVALIIGIGFSLWHGNMSTSGIAVESAPSYAEIDSITPTGMEDRL
ncbi:MAG: hypothetical protein IJK84_08805 [Bacteroidales bacterium]|nr:hypothetical protein [Bacteroidales bacterium]